MIPPDQLDNILRAVRIEDVVSDFVHLKKRGANYLGLCPFHNEKTPSFTVSPVKGIFKCFGCGKAGNAVGFLMEHLHITYPEAIRWLAKKYNIPLQERELSPEELQSANEKESIYILLKHAAEYYQKQLFESDEGKSVGLSYLFSRGIEEHTIRTFGIGYAPSEKKSFTQSAIRNKFKKIFLIKSGQSIYKSNKDPSGILPSTEDDIEESALFDRFQARIMFPVHDESGRILGFGGRTLSNDKNIAKYVNSPESLVYHKSEVLYGLYQAKKHIQKENTAVLTEGYMDVIALHQNGIQNAVASSGTSLTEQQVKKIHRFAENVIIAFDGDQPGKNAAERAVPMLLEEGLSVFLISFPSNHDPDSFARTFGKKALTEHFQKNSTDFLEYYINESKNSIQNNPVEKSSFIRKMASWISLIPDDIRRQVYIQELSRHLHIPELALVSEVSGIRRERLKKTLAKDIPLPQTPPADAIPQTPENNTSEVSIQHADEVEILRHLILHGNLTLDIESAPYENASYENTTSILTLAEYVLQMLSFEQIMFSDPLHHKIFSLYFENLTEKGTFPDIQFFLNYPDDEIRNFISKNFISSHDLSEKWEKFGIALPDQKSITAKAILKSILSLKEKILSQIIANLKQELKNPSLQENDVIILLHKIKQFEKEKTHLNKILGRTAIRFHPNNS